MPGLVSEKSESLLDLDPTDRLHWTAGRALDNDMVITDIGVSRYHATIFSAHGNFYIIDHSFNGTHVFRKDESPDIATKLPTVFLSPEKLAPKEDKPAVNKDTEHFVIPTMIAKEDDKKFSEKLRHSHISHVMHRLQEKESRIPRIAGYEPHILTQSATLGHLLEMVYSTEEVDNLISMGRMLQNGDQILFAGKERYLAEFTE